MQNSGTSPVKWATDAVELTASSVSTGETAIPTRADGSAPRYVGIFSEVSNNRLLGGLTYGSEAAGWTATTGQYWRHNRLTVLNAGGFTHIVYRLETGSDADFYMVALENEGMDGLRSPMKIAADGTQVTSGASTPVSIPNNSIGNKPKFVYVSVDTAGTYIKPGDSTVTSSASIGLPVGANNPLILDVSGQTHIAVFGTGQLFNIVPLENS